MYCIFAKSTGNVLRNVEEDYQPLVFWTLTIARAYLNERYTESGTQLWIIERAPL